MDLEIEDIRADKNKWRIYKFYLDERDELKRMIHSLTTCELEKKRELRQNRKFLSHKEEQCKHNILNLQDDLAKEKKRGLLAECLAQQLLKQIDQLKLEIAENEPSSSHSSTSFSESEESEEEPDSVKPLPKLKRKRRKKSMVPKIKKPIVIPETSLLMWDTRIGAIRIKWRRSVNKQARRKVK